MISTESFLWVVTGVIAVGLLLLCERTQFRPGIAVAKITASTCFVGLGLSLDLLATAAGQILLVGMLLCWLGDALLLPLGQSIWFQLGIGAFLLGHVAYAASFLTQGIDPVGALTAGVLVGLVSWRVLVWLAPSVPPDFAVAVRCYVVVIGAMVALSIGAVRAGANPLLAAGAVAFAASDLSVARERFIRPTFLNSLWGLPLYYASQMLLAFGATRGPVSL